LDRKAAWRDTERRRDLGDRLALAISEALAHSLDHLPLTRDTLPNERWIWLEPRILAKLNAARSR